MAHLLIVILHDLEKLPELLQAWRRIGVPGVTLMNSVGGYQAETWLNRIGLSGLSRVFTQHELVQRTIFSVIGDEELLELAISEADEVIEGFDREESGILFSIPIEHTLGLRKRGIPEVKKSEEVKEIFDDLLSIQRHTPVSDIVEVLALSPVIVSVEASIESIVTEVIAHPRVHLVCVVNNERRLMGVIDLATLADAMFFATFPEEFLRDLRGLDEVMDFARRTKMRYASDLMKEPVWVKMEDNLEKAFVLMHENKLPGLPVVDDFYHVVEYINLLELMAVCLKIEKDQKMSQSE